MKTFQQILLVFAAGCMLTGCYYDDTDIKQTIDENKATQDSINVKTSVQQGDAIEQTLQLLTELKDNIYTYLNDSLSVAFQNQIDDLQSQIVSLKNSDDSICTWIQNTYTTLEQYEELSTLLSTTKEELMGAMENMDSTLRADITAQINALESSTKDWVSSQLQGYYSITEIDSLLQLQRTDIVSLMANQDSLVLDSLSKVNSSLLDSIDNLRNAIHANQDNIDSVRVQLTREYQAEISTAINEYDGQIKGYIKNQIDSINNQISLSIESIKDDIETIKQDIDIINQRIEDVVQRIDALETDVNKLLSQIQSVTYLPKYTDGLVKVNKILVDEDYEYQAEPIEFLVRPEECAEALELSMLSIKSIAPQVRHAPSIYANPSNDFEIELFIKGDTPSQKGIIQISLKDNEKLRRWYESTESATIALFIDNDATNTHVNSGFVISLSR